MLFRRLLWTKSPQSDYVIVAVDSDLMTCPCFRTALIAVTFGKSATESTQFIALVSAMVSFRRISCIEISKISDVTGPVKGVVNNDTRDGYSPLSLGAILLSPLCGNLSNQ